MFGVCEVERELPEVKRWVPKSSKKSPGSERKSHSHGPCHPPGRVPGVEWGAARELRPRRGLGHGGRSGTQGTGRPCPTATEPGQLWKADQETPEE